MRVLVINPVTTDKWNRDMEKYLKKVVHESTEISVVNLRQGPKSIETFFDEVYAGPGIMETVKRSENHDAIVINCFGDPALDALREISSVPVLGAGETSMTAALLLGEKFGVISVSRNYRPYIERMARKIGISRRLAYASGIDIPVLDLNRSMELMDMVIEESEKAIEKGAEVIVLGCTAMFFLAEDLRRRLEVSVIEPASLTLKLAEALAILRLKHSKIGIYMEPDPKKLIIHDKKSEKHFSFS